MVWGAADQLDFVAPAWLIVLLTAVLPVRCIILIRIKRHLPGRTADTTCV